jgi:RNA-directed DNA polymerase
MSMHADEESDEGVVPMKRSNNEGVSSAETVEGRTSPKGNGGETAAARTLRRGTASNGLIAVRQAARQSKSVRFTALLHHITTDLLKQSYLSLERDSAPGIDGVTWLAYGENLEGKLKELHDKVHRGSYRAHPARRTYIPKADGSQRAWRIKSSNRRSRRFSRPSTKRTSSGSPTDSGQDADSTMRWTLSMSAFSGGR